VSRIATAATAPLAGASLYLAGLTAAAAAAARRRPPRPPADSDLPDALVLVPAHDEEAMIGSTVAALRALDYASGRFDVAVIADNCTDRTATEARAAGALVLERRDPELRGKGHALAWALDRIDHSGRLVLLVDADCRPSPGLLRAASTRIAAGAEVVQAAYTVSNPDDSPAAALRQGAFALVNTVRPLGKSALGLSCGLLGTGMAFAPGVLERVPWRSFSLAEDAEQHLRLVEAGLRAEFCPEAGVSSPMPASLAGGADQQSRWEAGRALLLRDWTPRLLGRALARRDPLLAHAALEQAIPPLSMLAAATAATGAAALATRSRPARRLSALALAGQAAHVIGGLALTRAPRATWRALVLAPALAARKARIYGDMASGRGPSTWVRTERTTPAQVNSKSVGIA
jgi:1,2-diacylglycerol 3-beta-glucosyltransferase